MSSEKQHLSDKANRYISQLSQARCEGRWSEVPELARKVEKHAPTRRTLVATARTEATLEQRLQGTGRTPAKATNLASDLVDPLLAKVTDPAATSEDRFQCRICAQSLHWIEGKYDQAILVVSSELLATAVVGEMETEKEGQRQQMGWTAVCGIKGAFIRGSCQEAVGRNREAVATYKEAAARILSSGHSSVKDTNQYKLWMERLLNRYSRMMEPTGVMEGALGTDLTSVLEVFRTWAKTGPREASISGSSTGGLALEDQLSRRKTWLSYYQLLSSLVARVSGAVHEHSSLNVGDVVVPSRTELCNEVNHVGSIYEGLLIKEVAFPQASQYNYEVDEWVDQAMSNWTIFSSYSWSDADIAQSGKRALSQKMLDILYRAATRSFHSMTILRHLSAVHSSLGEFNLARKALDSYVTIGTKAKARVQKSGKSEPGIDSDDTFVRAISGGIEMLCTFGERNEAVRACELAAELEQMLDNADANQSIMPANAPQQTEQEKLMHNIIRLNVSNETLAIAHRAIGVSDARWAHLTYEPRKRSDLQSTSIAHLQKSLQGGPTSETSIDALYALALARAENMDIQGAIAAVKEALLQSLSQESRAVPSAGHIGTRSLHPSTATTRCWHLLTLLLSSREDFDNAAASCDEALEQLNERLHSEDTSWSMNLAEKQSVISLRMTRLALKEVLENPEAAVNESMVLLALYGEMFKDSKPKEAAKMDGQLTTPSAGSVGRTLSIRESVFGRHKGERSSHLSFHPEAVRSSQWFSDATSHSPTLESPDGEESKRPITSQSHVSGLLRSGSKRLQKRSSKKSINRQGPAASAVQQPTTDEAKSKATLNHVNASTLSTGAPHLPPQAIGNNLQSNVGLAVSTGEASTGISPPTRPIILCNAVHYSEAEYRRRSLETLTSIWLFIATLYRRAGMYTDAASALTEALKQVSLIEGLVARERSSSAQFEQSGWGGAKSVEELWADAYAERGNLKLAQGRLYEAIEQFEAALTHWPDHVSATVGLAGILLDVYSGKVAMRNASAEAGTLAEEQEESETSRPVLATIPGIALFADPTNGEGVTSPTSDANGPTDKSVRKTDIKTSHTPEVLDRLAARDRAFNLLSTLSRLGTGWDRSEVWFSLARAYEESGQLDKAQEALWWVVELEKKRPIRHWSCLGPGYSLWF